MSFYRVRMRFASIVAHLFIFVSRWFHFNYLHAGKRNDLAMLQNKFTFFAREHYNKTIMMEFRRGLWRPLTGQTGNDAQCDLRTPWTWRAQCVLFAENDTSTIQIQSLNAENNKLVHNLITLINWRSLKFSSLTHNANYFLFYVAVNVRVIDIAEILISFDREPTIFFLRSK